MFSSPLQGISISTVWLWDNCVQRTVFVPSTGYLYFYWEGFNQWKIQQHVFVPSTGYLYFYNCCPCISKILKDGFRPLYGVSLFLHRGNWNIIRHDRVFVPSTGYLYFYLPRIPLENSKGIIWFAVQTHKPDNFMFISTCPELKMLYFTGIGAKS